MIGVSPPPNLKSQDAPRKSVTRISLDDLKGSSITRAVLKDCAFHPATILPGCASVATILFAIVALSPYAFLAGAALAAISIGAFAWNYGYNGVKRGVEKKNMLLEARRTQVIDEFVDFPAKCIKEGFVEAADKAVRLKAAYVTVVGYLNEHDEPTIEQFRFLTEDAFKQGAATLNLALDLYKALKSISPKSLQTELEDTRQKLKIVTGVAGSESLQKTLTSSIETIEQRLKLFKEKQTTIDALLSKATEIESQLQNSHIELAGLGTGDPSELLNADGDAVNNLKNTLAAAKEIENQLRSQGAGQTADEQMYQQAANKPHNNN